MSTMLQRYSVTLEKKINVDHINAAGSLRSSKDLPGFVERLFCEVDNLQVLCENI